MCFIVDINWKQGPPKFHWYEGFKSRICAGNRIRKMKLYHCKLHLHNFYTRICRYQRSGINLVGDFFVPTVMPKSGGNSKCSSGQISKRHSLIPFNLLPSVKINVTNIRIQHFASGMSTQQTIMETRWKRP